MKALINKYLKICFLTFAVMLFSCSPMDEYKDITGKEEIQYTGKIDSVKIFSGDERLFITGLFISDPKIVNCRIFWNLKSDSIDIPIKRTDGVDTLKKEISLAENIYNFEIFTYDAAGNKSVPVSATGKTYGEQYEASISNRLALSANLDSDSIIIMWRPIDLTLGPFATEVSYTTSDGKSTKKRVAVNETKTVLKNYKLDSEVSYSTLYLPEALCLDTFYTKVDLLPIE